MAFSREEWGMSRVAGRSRPAAATRVADGLRPARPQPAEQSLRLIVAALALCLVVALGVPAAAFANDDGASSDPKVCVDEVNLASIGQTSSAATAVSSASSALLTEDAAENGKVSAANGEASVAQTALIAAALTVPRFAPSILNAACSPEHIEVGKDCGMDWMCGIEPCLCGSSDSWGGCSCNGLEEAHPAISATSTDEGVVRVVEAFGKTWLVPCGAGTANVTIMPSLRYHAAVPVTVSITVGGLQVADAFLGFFVVLIVAIVVGGIVMHRRMKKIRGKR